MFTTDHLAASLPAFEKAGHIYVGYSGGLDSHVLLYSVVSLVGSDKVTALHINHQLSSNADHWQSHCTEQCRLLGVKFEAFRVVVNGNGNGNGLEQAARDARYRIFSAAMAVGDLLLLGHHADDQAETVLYRLLRGSGPKGLAAMPKHRPLGAGELLRPLLNVTRAELRAYALQEGLSWIEDESNEQISFDRNYLRHQVVPVLQARWPDLAGRLAMSAERCRQSDLFMSEIAADDLASCDERSERVGVSIALASIEKLSVLRRQNLIRYWLQQLGYSMPPTIRLERIHRELIAARADANPCIEFGDCELRRYNQRIYLLPKRSCVDLPKTPILWSGKEPLIIPDIGWLSPLTTSKSIERLSVRFRVGGERVVPFGEMHTRPVKKLLNELHLEPWLRDTVPFIYCDNQLIAIAGLVTVEEGFSCEFHWY